MAPEVITARSNKARRGSSPHQAQLPTFRRSLPALSVLRSDYNRELLLERDAFMAQLTREEEEKTQLECWAATRIQAYFRGFRSRPRREGDVAALETRVEIEHDANEALKTGRRTPKRSHTHPGMRSKSIYRGYYLRSWIHRLVPKLKHDAAVQIQALVRGSQARERVAMLLFERKCEERRRAGLPFQITLGSRVSIIHKNGLASDSSTSSLSVLYENRKPRASLDFRTRSGKKIGDSCEST
ncbi:IQ motif, EF-hand binding site [Phytophthora cactorum]|nr:IQ motif, EF-hand binding site [Phytophthora cactorum]